MRHLTMLSKNDVQQQSSYVLFATVTTLFSSTIGPSGRLQKTSE